MPSVGLSPIKKKRHTSVSALQNHILNIFFFFADLCTTTTSNHWPKVFSTIWSIFKHCKLRWRLPGWPLTRTAAFLFVERACSSDAFVCLFLFVFHLPNVGIWDGIHSSATATYAGWRSTCAIGPHWKHLTPGVRNQSGTIENDSPNCTRTSSGVRGRRSCALDTPISAWSTISALSSASATEPSSTALARDCTRCPTTCPPLPPNCKYSSSGRLADDTAFQCLPVCRRPFPDSSLAKFNRA